MDRVIQFVKPNGFFSKNNNQFVIREGNMCIRHVNGYRRLDKTSIKMIVRKYSAQFIDLKFSDI